MKKIKSTIFLPILMSLIIIYSCKKENTTTNTTSTPPPTTTATYTIGQNYGGGIIVYIDGTGQHGLISALTDQGAASWGCSGTAIGGADGLAIGTGAQNTTDIITGCTTTTIAAKVCEQLVLNSFSDWFLPSKDELNLIYQQKSLLGTFATGYYWSSSESTSTFAEIQRMVDGNQTQLSKPNNLSIRAMRAF